MFQPTGDLEIDDRVLSVIEKSQQPLEPSNVVLVMLSEGFREDRIRASVWKLIDRNVLKLNADWTVVPLDGAESDESHPTGRRQLSPAD